MNSNLLRQSFDLELLSPCIFSRTSQTTGGHHTLRHVPAAAIIGLLASRFYADAKAGRLEGASAWALFHSGAFRVSDALPISPRSGQRALPIPFSLHHAKDEKAIRGDGRIDPSSVVDLSHRQLDPGVQPKQCREMFVTSFGEAITPRTIDVRKTAFDTARGRPEDGQLFGYEALAEGQRFRFDVSCDLAQLPRSVVDRILDFLAPSPGSARHRIGRSRSAEFGSIRLIRTTEMEAYWSNPRAGTIWCATDITFMLPDGRLSIDPADLDDLIKGWRYEPARSFVRSRAITPFNGHFGVDAPTRDVIEAGSVLAFSAVGAQSHSLLEQLVALLAFSETALDALRFASDFEIGPIPELVLQRKPRAASAHPLIGWLRGRADAEGRKAAFEQSLVPALAIWQKHYGASRRAGVVAPTVTQWNQVAEEARLINDRARLFERLFEGNGTRRPIIDPSRAPWSQEAKPGRTFGQMFRDAAEQVRNEPDFQARLVRIAESGALAAKQAQKNGRP